MILSEPEGAASGRLEASTDYVSSVVGLGSVPPGDYLVHAVCRGEGPVCSSSRMPRVPLIGPLPWCDRLCPDFSSTPRTRPAGRVDTVATRPARPARVCDLRDRLNRGGVRSERARGRSLGCAVATLPSTEWWSLLDHFHQPQLRTRREWRGVAAAYAPAVSTRSLRDLLNQRGSVTYVAGKTDRPPSAMTLRYGSSAAFMPRPTTPTIRSPR